MMNAKIEFQKMILQYINPEDIIAANIFYSENQKIFKYDSEHKDIYSFEQFLNDLDFEYDNGYGWQKLFGFVLCSGNIFFTREKYTRCECWEKMSYYKRYYK